MITENDVRRIRGSDKVILALDDTPLVLDLIKDILENEYELRLAKTETAAFGILRRESVDMALLDIEMPGMSGLEFFEYAKKNNYFRSTKVIFITGNAVETTVKKALRLGADGYIIKPFTAEQLREKVRDVFAMPSKNG